MPYLEIGIRCLLGTVFVVSFATKVAGRGAFADFETSVRTMRVLAPKTTRLVALVVVGVEPVVCVLLATPSSVAVMTGFVIAAGLLIAFATAIVLAMRRGVRIPCRCFGASKIPLGPQHVARNAVLAAVAIVGAVTASTTDGINMDGLAIAVSAGLVLGGLVVTLDHIIELFQPVHKVPGPAREPR